MVQAVAVGGQVLEAGLDHPHTDDPQLTRSMALRPLAADQALHSPLLHIHTRECSR